MLTRKENGIEISFNNVESLTEVILKVNELFNISASASLF